MKILFSRAFTTIFKTLQEVFQSDEFRILLSILGVTITTGTVFYHFVEKWSWIDSFYFCFITLTTVGYGDFSPHTIFGKLFTILYILIGIILLVAFIDASVKVILTHAVHDLESHKE